MHTGQDRDQPQRVDNVRVLRPRAGRPADRHILLGVSHPSNDPSRHRVFEVRAAFDTAAGGWVAQVGEQNLNEQRGNWAPLLRPEGQVRAFPSAASCLGDAVATIIAAVDQDADATP